MPSELKKPEPAFKLHWDGERARYTVSKPNIDDTDVYTAAQLEQYAADRVRGALERAAFIAEHAHPSEWPFIGGTIRTLKEQTK